jgi:hypothetical protein
LRAVRRLLHIVLLALAAAVLLAGCGGGKEGKASAAKPEPATTTAPAADGACTQVDQPAGRDEGNLPKPKLKLDPSQTWTVTMATNCGDFTIALDVKRAPKTASSFARSPSRASSTGSRSTGSSRAS